MGDGGREVHHYGDTYVGGYMAERGTVHGSGTIDVVIDPEECKVTAVWFRCRTLPFTVSERPGPEVEQPAITLTAVEYVGNE